MVDITLEQIATNNPVSTNLTGDEPIETEISLVGRGLRLRQMSSTPINAQTGASYQLVLTDQGKAITMNNASSNTVTIPPNATVAFPIGTTLIIRQIGIGTTSIAAGGGVIIQKKVSVGLGIVEQYGQVVLHKTAIDTWHLAGELGV